jgi:hypothetical protein
MEDEIIETVLKEILDEIKIIHEQNIERKRYEEDFKNKIQSIEQKLLSIETKSSGMNLMQVQLETNAKKIEKIINDQPKNIIHKKQILLFPEYGAREYYKLVFGRLLFWMMMFLLAFYFFSLGKQFIDNWREVKLSEMKIQYENSSQNHKKQISYNLDTNSSAKNLPGTYNFADS